VYGNALTAANHPESRAIFYQDFSKKKISSFLGLLTGFQKSLKLLDALDFNGTETSVLLRKLTRTKESDEEGRFPDFKTTLEFFNVWIQIPLIFFTFYFIKYIFRKLLTQKMLSKLEKSLLARALMMSLRRAA